MKPCLGNFHISVCKSYIKVSEVNTCRSWSRETFHWDSQLKEMIHQWLSRMGGKLAAFRSLNSLIRVCYKILNSKSQFDYIHFTLQLSAWRTHLGLNHAMALQPHLPHNLTHVNLRKQMQLGVCYEQFKRKPDHTF